MLLRVWFILCVFVACAPPVSPPPAPGPQPRHPTTERTEVDPDVIRFARRLKSAREPQIDAVAPSGSCEPTELRLLWPVPGDASVDWVLSQGFHYEAIDALIERLGARPTGEAHRGIDIAVGSFRDAGTPVLATSDGTVLAVHDGEPDHNTRCEGTWNHVEIREANGFRTLYGHLARGSIPVKPGQEVRAGELIGRIGSSGCSTGPHLHHELLDCQGAPVDTMALELWERPPSVPPQPGILELVVAAGGLGSVDAVIDPPQDAVATPLGQPLGIGLSTAGGAPGDEPQVELVGPDGYPRYSHHPTFAQAQHHHLWFTNVRPEGPAGTWQVRVRWGDLPELVRNIELY